MLCPGDGNQLGNGRRDAATRKAELVKRETDRDRETETERQRQRDKEEEEERGREREKKCP